MAISVTGTKAYYPPGVDGLVTAVAAGSTGIARPPTIVTTLPAPWVDADIGSPALAGSSSLANGVFTVNGSGADIWATIDQFHFVYQPLTGDGTIIARVTGITVTNAWCRAGLMIKQSATAGAPYVLVTATGTQGYDFQSNFNNTVYGPAGNPPVWLKLTRSGSTVTGSSSPDGLTWTVLGSATLAGAAIVGLCVNSNDAGLINTSTFDNVSVTGGNVTPSLPFNLPDMSTSPKKVLGHLFGPFKVTFDDLTPQNDYYATEHLNPNGEHGSHVSYGGFLRDRPMPRPPRGGDYVYADCLDWVQTAKAAGLDGFFCDILGEGGHQAEVYAKTIQAANAVAPGFLVVPMVDASSIGFSYTEAQIAAWIAPYYGKSSTWMVGSSMVVGTFLTEKYTVARWNLIASTLASTYGIPSVKWVFVFNDINQAPNYTSSAYASGMWGPGADANIAASYDPHATSARSRGEKALVPVWSQDIRPNQSNWNEARNMDSLRGHWTTAINNDADIVQLTTWCDFSEGSQFCPTPARGRAALDISSYYITKLKTGSYPQIVRDCIYLSYRNHVSGAQVLFNETSPMVQRTYGSSTTPVRYAVEALAFLQSAATVEITVNGVTTSFSGVAGINSFTVNAVAGTVSSRIVRSGTPIATINSPVPIRSTVWVQDRQYFNFGSLRGTTGQFDPMFTSAGAIPTYPSAPPPVYP